jgi:hypothetical protein
VLDEPALDRRPAGSPQPDPDAKIPALCRDLHGLAGHRRERRTRLELATLSQADIEVGARA